MRLAKRAVRQKRTVAMPRRPVRGGDNGPSAASLLAWYRRHRRRLPWRAEPGETADPYRVWLSEIMLQQTTVRAVASYYDRFLTRFPTLPQLAEAKLDDVLKLWAGLGYYARARNLHACAQAVLEKHGGIFPGTEEELRTLPGIGLYTAAAIASIAFGRKATPVDGNIERVIARLFAIETPLPAAKPVIRAHAEHLTPSRGAGDFAQAMMDLGATICTPRNPACALCPWMAHCRARERGDMETFPRKTPKAEGALRRGAAFVVMREDGAILVRTRPATGLLGGMTEVPTTEWTRDFNFETALAHAPSLLPPPVRGKSTAGAESEGGREGGHPNTERESQHTPLPSPPPQGGREFILRASKSDELQKSFRVEWRRLPGTVTHVFTHFPLELTVYRTLVPKGTKAPGGARWSAEISGEALPNLMRKVIAHAGVPRRPG